MIRMVRFKIGNGNNIANPEKRINLRPFIIVIALIAIWGVLAVATKGTFVSSRNLSLLFTQMSSIAIIAVGMVLVIVSGYIDLSVGSIVAFCGAVSAIMQVQLGVGTLPSILVPILVGILLAAWNGYWAAYQKVPAFIVTLASMLIFRGLTLKITGGSTISSLEPGFKYFGVGYLPPVAGFIIAGVGVLAYIVLMVRKQKDMKEKGMDTGAKIRSISKVAGISAIVLLFVLVMNCYEGIPIPVVILILVTFIVAFMALKTRFGRRLYAIGGNPEAARLSGINVKKEVFKIYLVLGALSALAGLILTARLNAATPNAGTSYEFDAISAAIIGGTSFMGGEGTVFGALIGSLIMASLNNGMSLLNMDPYYQYVIKGLVLLIAVWFDISARKRGSGG